MTDGLNDNTDSGRRLPPPDAHGHAALLLVESLLHGLVARKLIATADAVEIVAVAAEVKEEIGDELGNTPEALARSLTLLAAIGSSLSADLPSDADATFT